MQKLLRVIFYWSLPYIYTYNIYGKKLYPIKEVKSRITTTYDIFFPWGLGNGFDNAILQPSQVNCNHQDRSRIRVLNKIVKPENWQIMGWGSGTMTMKKQGTKNKIWAIEHVCKTYKHISNINYLYQSIQHHKVVKILPITIWIL